MIDTTPYLAKVVVGRYREKLMEMLDICNEYFNEKYLGMPSTLDVQAMSRSNI